MGGAIKILDRVEFMKLVGHPEHNNVSTPRQLRVHPEAKEVVKFDFEDTFPVLVPAVIYVRMHKPFFLNLL